MEEKEERRGEREREREREREQPKGAASVLSVVRPLLGSRVLFLPNGRLYIYIYMRCWLCFCVRGR
ncbi:hypothetical protein RchiOBHm_Chr3g0452081 [Rosa chinensis]|uniref:Uncharacterized protein n=1 Tax=Rosa chinensis TaxID=74649 RepID=A0A2P6R699_ROSCH|nr:hypothetical protein RchiOBHm_Chr3g0452081 [Rosa chinensis]